MTVSDRQRCETSIEKNHIGPDKSSSERSKLIDFHTKNIKNRTECTPFFVGTLSTFRKCLYFIGFIYKNEELKVF